MYTQRDTAQDHGVQVSLATYAYDELKRALLVGDFRLGSRLGETALASELGVSRTPIREALSRLHAEGLVVRFDEGGYGPAAPDLHTITELYEVRRGLEFTALSRGGHDEGALLTLQRDWRDLDPALEPTTDGGGPAFVLLDEEFHVRLALAAGNRALTELLVHVNERIRIVRMHDFLTPDRVRTTVSEHLEIVDALLGGDDATELLRTHLDVSERIVEGRAALALSRMIGSDRGLPRGVTAGIGTGGVGGLHG